MTAGVADRAIAWPSWLVPAQAVEAWRVLLLALASTSVGPPCSHDPEVWFASAQSRHQEDAIAGCLVCPVLHQCRAYALAADEREGVWGGLTAAERRAVAGDGS